MSIHLIADIVFFRKKLLFKKNQFFDIISTMAQNWRTENDFILSEYIEIFW